MQTYDPTYMPVTESRHPQMQIPPHIGPRLQCPCCRTDLEELECPACGFSLQLRNGIVQALSPERGAHYEPFIRDYEHIRAAEGRGSQSEGYYLGLPYRDATGRNTRQWGIRARSYDYLITHILKQLSRGATILDLGAGNCWMSYRLTLAGYCCTAVDLLTNDCDGLGAAQHYSRHLPGPLSRFQAEFGFLPFQSEQFDAVIFNSSFHYTEDEQAALQEALRCLKPRGLLIISDTPWYSNEDSGIQMVAERRAAFQLRYGTESRSLRSVDFVTDARLEQLEQCLSIRWQTYEPWHGFRWAMRPWIAKLQKRREPSRFHIHVAVKHA